MTGRIAGALAILAIIAVLSPTVGAVFDHHIAERMADHGHVYYGRPDLRHKHGYETPHSDTRVGVARPALPNAVVVLPSNSAAKDGAVTMAATGFTLVPAPFALNATVGSAMPSSPDHRPGPVFLSPPYTPPRTFV